MDLPEPYLSKFLARRDTSGGPDACWPWTAGRDGSGYGMASVGPQVRERTHRIAVMLDGRTIPIGMTVDHLCRNRACANPLHLDVITRGENVRRGVFPTKAQCRFGHSTPNPSFRTSRGNCKECKRVNGLAAWRSNYVPHPKPIRTHCPRGHSLTGDNVRVLLHHGRTERVCRTCKAEYDRRRHRDHASVMPHSIRSTPSSRRAPRRA